MKHLLRLSPASAALAALLAAAPPCAGAVSFRSLLEHGKKDATYYMSPRESFLCMEGREAYLNSVLRRFKDSNMAFAWNSTSVKQGTCGEHGFEKDPNPIDCFPSLTVWLPKDNDMQANMDAVGMEFVQQYRRVHPEAPMEPDVKCFGKADETPMSYIAPAQNFLCLEGHKDYLKEVLQHFQESNMQLAWKDTAVTEGTCADHGFEKDPSPIRCFPNSTVWLPKDQDVLEKMDQIGLEYVSKFRKTHPEAPELPDVKCMTQAAPTSLIMPKQQFMCIEGAGHYLDQVLLRFKDSNLASAWDEAKVQKGSCTDHGFEKDPNPIECFPKATVWVPKDPQAQRSSEAVSARFIQEHRRTHPEAPEVSNVKCMADETATQTGTFMVSPAKSWLCVEGEYDDLSLVLDRFKESNMVHAWKDSAIKKGHCADSGFEKDPNPVQCFSKSTMWLPKDPELRKNMHKISAEFVQQYHNEHLSTGELPNMHCITS